MVLRTHWGTAKKKKDILNIIRYKWLGHIHSCGLDLIYVLSSVKSEKIFFYETCTMKMLLVRLSLMSYLENYYFYIFLFIYLFSKLFFLFIIFSKCINISIFCNDILYMLEMLNKCLYTISKNLPWLKSIYIIF